MQLGMIGLGRMGANMVRRLMRGGHDCVVYDVSPDAVAELAGEGAHRRRLAGGLRRRSWQPPRCVWLMVPAAFVDDDARRSSRRCSRPATSSSTAATPTTATTSRRARGARRAGHPLRRHGHERRRLRPRARLLPDDRRRRRGRRSASTRSSARSRRASTPRRARPAARATRARRAGLPALRPGRRRALREDGPQRDRVRDDGRLRRGAQHPRSTPTSAPSSSEHDAETTPLREPELYQYDLDSPRSPRSGGAAASSRSWLLDLTAAALRAGPRARRLRRPRLGLRRGPLDRRTPRSTRACPPRCSPRRCSRASPRAARTSSPTRCCRRCASASAGTWRRAPRSFTAGRRGEVASRHENAHALLAVSAALLVGAAAAPGPGPARSQPPQAAARWTSSCSSINDFHGNLAASGHVTLPGGVRHRRRRRGRVPGHARQARSRRAEPRTRSSSPPATSSAPARWCRRCSTTSRRSRPSTDGPRHQLASATTSSTRARRAAAHAERRLPPGDGCQDGDASPAPTSDYLAANVVDDEHAARRCSRPT